MPLPLAPCSLGASAARIVVVAVVRALLSRVYFGAKKTSAFLLHSLAT
jgi:hypothetical protein